MGYDHFYEEAETEKWLLMSIISAILLVSAIFSERFLEGLSVDFLARYLGIHATLPQILYHILITVFGGYILVIGLKKLYVKRKFSAEFLMGVVAVASTYIDLLFEGATVLTLFIFSEFIEKYIEDRARESVSKLVEYMPQVATLLRNGSEVIVDTEEVVPGDIIIIKPGERIPLDGIIIEGESDIDESTVTGENIPVFKKIGDEVYAGTLNLNGVIKVEVSKPAEETLMSKIVELVMEARARKANIENVVDRFSEKYVPIVVALAAFISVIPPYLLGGDLSFWLYRAMILLVLACPSAFIVSVPATFFASVTYAARKGVIVKGGIYMEKFRDVKTFIFDKTGTLTYGKPKVVERCYINTLKNKELLSVVASLERYSNHPIAKGILEYASAKGVKSVMEVAEIREYPGKGIVGRVGDRKVVVGSIEFIKSLVIGGDIKSDEHTNVYVVIGDSYVGSLCLEDKVREDAVQAVQTLKSMGLRTVLLTGDNEGVAKKVADQLGIDEYYAEVRPDEKLSIVEEYRRFGEVAMVGDGVNDAPALAVADVGIAMGGSGTQVALETADMVLVKDDLSVLPYIYKLAVKTYSIARENIAISISAKLLLGVLGMIGLIPIWFVVAIGDDGITLLLLANITRLAKTI